jgi:AraC family transcriptional regulator
MVSHALRKQDSWHPGLWSATAHALCINETRQAKCSAEAVQLLDDVRHALERNPEGARAVALRLVALFSPPAEATSAGACGDLAPWQQRRIDRYVREHLEEPMRVEELASQISLSVSYFCRAFKASFGVTPHAYIIRLRLTLAQELMLSTGDPLSEIVFACGFANQAHLSKLFRRTM